MVKKIDQDCPFEPLRPSATGRDDTFFMSLAYNEALKAWRKNEVPIGALIVQNGSILAQAHNSVETLKDPTAHAEILALTQAARAIGNWRCEGATLYVTKEPCPMCSGALVMSRISRLVFALPDPKMGCVGGRFDLSSVPEFNHAFSVKSGILQTECGALLREFFQRRRQKIDLDNNG